MIRRADLALRLQSLLWPLMTAACCPGPAVAPMSPESPKVASAPAPTSAPALPTPRQEALAAQVAVPESCQVATIPSWAKPEPLSPSMRGIWVVSRFYLGCKWETFPVAATLGIREGRVSGASDGCNIAHTNRCPKLENCFRQPLAPIFIPCPRCGAVHWQATMKFCSLEHCKTLDVLITAAQEVVSMARVHSAIWLLSQHDLPLLELSHRQ